MIRPMYPNDIKTAAERRHVVIWEKSLHAVHGMAKDDFGCYVKNLLNDVDGHSTQRHIQRCSLPFCFNEHVRILSKDEIKILNVIPGWVGN